MGKVHESNMVSIKLPAELVKRISELNAVDSRYVERTIARILRDEIAVEEKLKDLQEADDEQSED